MERLFAYRQRLFKAIENQLALDGCCKSVEGAVSVHMPDHFTERDEQPQWVVEVYVYVLGPSRNYSFSGSNLDECLDKADAALADWEADIS